MKRNLPALFFPLLCLLLASCQSQPSAPEPQGRRFELTGRVLSVDKAQQTATIKHEEVKGFMDAMTMTFKLKDAWPLDVMRSGDGVQATLVVTDTSAWLEEVVVVQKPYTHEDVPGFDETVLLQPGSAVPDFKLINQDGKRVSLSQYRGKALLITFIYTRCPVPEYCTLMSNNFAAIEQELSKDPALYERTHLLSVSFDPEHDTPKVLRSYGAAHTGRYDKETFSHWEFAAGEKPEIFHMAQTFNFSYVPEKDQIAHSLNTVLLRPDGKFAKSYRGNDWKPEEVLRDMRGLLPDSDRQ